MMLESRNHANFSSSHYPLGEFRDTNCAKNPVPHAMLLVGYTEKTLRVKARYMSRQLS